MKDKCVLVTGSTKGIGRVIAELFLTNGANVAFNSRNPADLHQLIASLNTQNAIGVVGDVSDPVQAQEVVSNVVSKFSAIDILICNVGSGKSVPPGQESYHEWLSMFHKNFLSVTNTIEVSKPYLIDSKASIVCISSICGLESVPGAPLTYSIAKSALNTYIRGIAQSLGKHGVRINAVAPGNILFPGSTWEAKLQNSPDLVHQMLKDEVALSRLGHPIEIAKAVMWLASSDSSFCTGSIFVADGGQVRRW